MSNETLILKMKGKLMWPKLFTPDTAFNNSRWTLDLLLDEDAVKEAKKHDLRLKKVRFNKKTQETTTPYADQFDGYDGTYLQIDMPTHKQSGEANTPPPVKDAKLRDVRNISIGNGSDANVRFLVKNRDKSAIEEWGGYGCYLLGVQILNLIEYEGASDPDVDFVSEDASFEVATEDAAFSFEDGDDLPFDPDVQEAAG